MLARPWSGRRVSNSWPRPWKGRALPTELHPQKVQGMPSASTEAALRQLVKERPPRAAVRSIDRWPAPMRQPVRVEKEKGPDPFGIRASANRARKDALCASLSRMHLEFRPIQPAIAGRDEGSRGADVHAIHRGMRHRGKPQGSAHERTQTLRGSVCPDDVAWFHEQCLD
jgi:hypothetical protein